MATDPTLHEPPLNLREQLARIDQIQADIKQKLAAIRKTDQETRFGPFTLVFTGMGAAAAFFAAGVAFAKLFTG